MEEKERVCRNARESERVPPPARFTEEKIVDSSGDLALFASLREHVEILGRDVSSTQKLDLTNRGEPGGTRSDAPRRNAHQLPAARDGQDEELVVWIPIRLGPGGEPLPSQEDRVRP